MSDKTTKAMTAPDMRDARDGAVVTFRSGGKVTVRKPSGPRAEGEESQLFYLLWFEGFEETRTYWPDGKVRETTSGRDLLDIVHIEPAPLTIEDQLAAANAALREREDRMAEIRLILSGRQRFHANDQRVEVSLKLLWEAIDRAIALVEKRPEAEPQQNTHIR